MGVTTRSSSRWGRWAIALALAACGSGNLGTVPGQVSVAPPPSAMVSDVPEMEEQNDTAKPQGGCGDGVAQSALGEQCDGSDLGGHSCTNLGLGDGELGCDAPTCQLVISGCNRQPSALPASDAGALGPGDGGLGDAMVDGDAGTACPSGFTCRAAIVQGMQTLCTSWAEETPPLCFNPGTSSDCATLLPGSTCTMTNLGSFCTRPCTP